MGFYYDAGMKQNYSYLFQGMSGGAGNLNFLSDYASIKNGSYGKLMKSYYGGIGGQSTSLSSRKTNGSDVLDRLLEEKKYPKVSKEAQKANSDLTAGLSSLTGTVSTLQNENTYTASEDGTSAADKVTSAVKSFVSQYNNVVAAAKDSTLAGKTAHVAGMMKITQANVQKLAEIGITLKRDGTLQLDEGKLKGTDTARVQELFSKEDVMSYGSAVMARLGFASASSGPVSSPVKESAKQDEAALAGAAALKTDIENLTASSLFEKIKGEDGTDQYDVEKLFGAVKSFVGNYNSMLDMADDSYNSGVWANVTRIREKTAQYKEALAEFGISVEENGRLKIDRDIFEKADMSRMQSFWKEYGPSIATNVSLVNYYMTTRASTSNGYTSGGEYRAQESFRYDAAT